MKAAAVGGSMQRQLSGANAAMHVSSSEADAFHAWNPWRKRAVLQNDHQTQNKQDRGGGGGGGGGGWGDNYVWL
jgi:hypothetical protein